MSSLEKRTPSQILLFDMDGVLLRAGGYHRALQESVAMLAKALGYRDVQLTQEDINLFEAVGITSEWDSSAICACLLLTQLWQEGVKGEIPANPLTHTLPLHDLPCPDFQSFCRSFAQQSHPDGSPLLRAEKLLLADRADRTALTHEQAALLGSVLHEARGIERSLTHRLFQEMVLGSGIFKTTYDLPAYLSVDSYLSLYDRPLLTPSDRKGLHAWLDGKNHFAAIFTNRPSRPPDGFFSTPEAEIGAQAAGVESLPIVGFGALSWFAFQHGLDPQAFLKPSPIHVLAALWLALHAGQRGNLDAGPEEALVQALEVSLAAAAGEGRENWVEVGGCQVFVFEDAVRGMKSAQSAQEVLAKMDIQIQVELCGITNSVPKQKSLSAVGAAVYPSLKDALTSLGIISA